MNIFASILADRAARGLLPEHQLPLWRWGASQDEREALQHLVVEGLSLDPIPTPVCAAFCLYAATHFCATHDGGAWSWGRITEAVGWSRPYTHLYQPIIRGMAFWRRPIITTPGAREFLVTLACEGGLPLKLLARPDSEGALPRYFRELLRLTETWRRPATEFAEALLPMLPVSLRNDQVSALTSTLIDAIVRVRVDVDASAVDPLASLDVRRPPWRSEIPMRLDDDVALSLLRGLLREPRVQEPPGEAPFLVTTHLVGENPPTVVRRVCVASRISEEKFSSVLGLQGDALPPPRVTVWLVSSDGQRRAVAVIARIHGGSEFAAERARDAAPSMGPSVAVDAVDLCFTAGAAEIAWLRPAGGDALPEELPWVFEGADKPDPELLAVGSYQSAAPVLRLSVPSESMLEPSDGARVQELGVDAHGRRLVRLEDRASWLGEESECAFRTGSTAQPARYAVVGRLERAGGVGSAFFRGAPTVVTLDGGTQRGVAPTRLQWRHARGPGPWRPWSDGPLGEIALRVLEGVEPVFASRIGVLPADCTFTLRPVTERAGIISVTCAEMTDLMRVRPDDTAESSTLTASGARELRVEIDPTSAFSTATIMLRFGGRREAVLTVPVPVRAAFFVDWDGRRLPQRAHVRFDRLAAVQARAFTPAGGDEFILQGRLTGGARWTDVVTLPDRSGVKEASLGSVQDFLSSLFAARSVDDEVELRILREGSAPTPGTCTLILTRHDARFLREHPDDPSMIVELEELSGCSLTVGERTRLRVIARPIERPEVPACELPRTGEVDRWVLSPQDLAPGPWLLQGILGEHCRVRPTLAHVPGTLAPTDSPLVATMRLGERIRREQQLREVLTQMAVAWAHPDWGRVREFVQVIPGLPAVTFDVLRALPDVPDAAVMALAQAPGVSFERLWSGLEQLPWMWCSAPVSSWFRALARLRDWAHAPAQEPIWKTLGWTPADACRQSLRALLDQGPRHGPFVEVVLEAAERRLLLGVWKGNPSLTMAGTQPGREQIAYLRNSELQSLMHRHLDDWWPSGIDPRDGARAAGVGRLLDVIAVAAPQPWQRAVLDAPSVCAALSVAGILPTTELLAALRRLRAFDTIWFDTAHAIALTQLLALPGVIEEVPC